MEHQTVQSCLFQHAATTTARCIFEKPVHILSLNVDDHPAFRGLGQYKWIASSYPQLLFKQRFEVLVQFILALNSIPQIIAFQEVGDDARILLEQFLSEHNYSFISNKYNNHEGCCNFITAFSNELDFKVKSSRMIYLTTSGLSLTDLQRQTMSREDKISHGLNYEFERSAQIISLENEVNGNKFTFVNTHPGLTNDHRIMCMKMLVVHVNDLKNVIIVGDFNQFDSSKNSNDVYQPQRQILFDAGFVSSTENIPFSFVGRPYDIMRFLSCEHKVIYEELVKQNDFIGLRQFCDDFYSTIDPVSSRLDDVFYRFDDSKCKATTRGLTYIDGKVIDISAIDRNELSEIVKQCTLNNKYTPSDHCAMLTSFE